MGNRYYTGPVTDHFDGKQFYHAGLPSTDKSLIDLLRWKLFGRPASWPQSIPARSGLKPDARVDGLRITAIGHSSMLIQAAGINILVDPVWSERASPFTWTGPRRHNPPAVALADLPPIHAVLVTHNHYDHMDTATIAALWQTHKPAVISPLGNDAVIRKDAPKYKCKPATGGRPSPSQIKSAPPSSPPITGQLAISAIDASPSGAALFSILPPAKSTAPATPPGRTERSSPDPRTPRRAPCRHSPHRRLRAPLVHEHPAHRSRRSVQIAIDIGAQHLLGVHWATFQLTDEPWEEPAQLLEKAMRERPPT